MTFNPSSVFAPGGRILQVENAHHGASRGSTVIGVVGRNCVVLGSEKRVFSVLEDERTHRKIRKVQDHMILGYAGLAADARVILHNAIAESESFKMITDEVATVGYITKYVATLKHKFTMGAGYRPFGVLCLIGGFEDDGTPHLYETEPSGNYAEWKANAIGRYSSTARQFLEARYTEEQVNTVDGTIKMTLKALLCIARVGQYNFDVCVLEKDCEVKYLGQGEIFDFITAIQAENH